MKTLKLTLTGVLFATFVSLALAGPSAQQLDQMERTREANRGTDKAAQNSQNTQVAQTANDKPAPVKVCANECGCDAMKK